MLTQTIRDRRAWRAGTIDDTASWTDQLSDLLLADLDRWIHAASANGSTVAYGPLPQTAVAALRTDIEPLRSTLFEGRGFVIIDRVPEHYSEEQAKAFYWGVGQLLGEPIAQNTEGVLLYSVRDTGQDVAQGARFSVTNAESSFHTDGAFWDNIPDVIGLLCLATAKSGGESQLISGYALHNELVDNHPDLLRVLYHDYCFDRRGGILEGESPVARHPIFRWHDADLTMRYLNYYIHEAHKKVDEPLTTDQVNALEAIEALLKRPDLQIRFSLQPGQMLFTNNHWILHNRTAFIDHEELAKRRHYVRLWLMRALQDRDKK